jgi:hypothetical protein
MRWLRLFGQVFRFFKWKDYSVSRRGCGNVKIGFIDFHIPSAFFVARYTAAASGGRWKNAWSGVCAPHAGVRASGVIDLEVAADLAFGLGLLLAKDTGAPSIPKSGWGVHRTPCPAQPGSYRERYIKLILFGSMSGLNLEE